MPGAQQPQSLVVELAVADADELVVLTSASSAPGRNTLTSREREVASPIADG